MRLYFGQLLSEAGLPSWLVPNYSLMLTASIVLGGFWTLHLWKSRGEDPKVGADLVFWAIPCLFVGAKVVYLLQFGFPTRLADLWGSGIALYGGFFGILTPWAVLYLVRPYNVLLFLDCVTPGLALGLCLTRIGCFLQGCNGGLVCSLPWAVQFPRGTSSYAVQVETGLIGAAEPFSLPVHPTQLYESLFGLAVLLPLYRLFQNSRAPGQTFLTGMLGYAVFRFLTESIRADALGMHPLAIFTFAQFLSLLIATAALAGLWLLRSRGPGVAEV